MIDILTIGDSDIDFFMKVSSGAELPGNEKHPKICFYHGSKVPVDEFGTSIAGNSVNVAVGCTMLGLNSSVYTEIGDDANGDRIIAGLQKRGVKTDFCIKNPGKETNMHAIVVFGGERTIFSYHGPFDYTIRDWDKPKWIYYTSMGSGFQKFQADLVGYINENSDVGLAFNPGTMQMKAGIESLRDVMSVSDIMFVNREETERLTGTSDLNVKDLHMELQQLGPKLTVITEGKKGASAYDGNTFEEIEPITDSRPVIDKTGAGDAFSSGFLSAIAMGKTLDEALRWGAINAGKVIKEIGAINGLASTNDIN